MGSWLADLIGGTDHQLHCDHWLDAAEEPEDPVGLHQALHLNLCAF